MALSLSPPPFRTRPKILPFTRSTRSTTPLATTRRRHLLNHHHSLHHITTSTSSSLPPSHSNTITPLSLHHRHSHATTTSPPAKIRMRLVIETTSRTAFGLAKTQQYECLVVQLAPTGAFVGQFCHKAPMLGVFAGKCGLRSWEWYGGGGVDWSGGKGAGGKTDLGEQ
nr:hypothetical protein [Tanacetum cinerariifolium]